MKKFFSFFVLAFMFLNAFSQTIVGTTPENKNVILEEFTGIHCGFCPQGHAIAQSIKDAHPDDVFLINIHVGPYASPSAGEPDFRTSFGTSIANQSGLTSYPAGTVNRHLFSGLSQGSGTAMNRVSWTNASNQTLAMASYVNVGVEASINLETRELTVHVEAYYTDNSPVSTNKLNVVLLQDNTLGPQSGGDMGNEYNHMHRLVHMITGQWGEEITTTVAGTFVDRTYTYTIPADYHSISAEFLDLKVVAYIAEGNQEIISGNGCNPTFTNFAYQNDAFLRDITVPENICEGITPSIKVQNLGSETITELTITTKINNEVPIVIDWTGEILPLLNQTIELDEISFLGLNENTITVTINEDENLENNIATTTIERILATETVYLTLVTDAYGSECTWNVKNSAGTTVYSGGPYGNGVTINETFTLPQGCYVFNLIDSYGDGGGAVTLKDDTNLIIYNTNGTYGAGASTDFHTGLLELAAVFSIAETDVPVDEPIIITFNSEIRLPNDELITNVNELITFVNNDAKSDVPFTAEISNNSVITITPDAELASLTSYTITIATESVENFSDVLLAEDVTKTFVTKETIGLNKTNNNINIYPNPTKDYFIVTNSSNSKLTIYNTLGINVLETNILNDEFRVDLSNLTQGSYIINITSDKQNESRIITIVR